MYQPHSPSLFRFEVVDDIIHTLSKSVDFGIFPKYLVIQSPVQFLMTDTGNINSQIKFDIHEIHVVLV